MPPTEHGDLNSDLRTNKHKQVKLKHKHGSEQRSAMVLIKKCHRSICDSLYLQKFVFVHFCEGPVILKLDIVHECWKGGWQI